MFEIMTNHHPLKRDENNWCDKKSLFLRKFQIWVENPILILDLSNAKPSFNHVTAPWTNLVILSA